MERLRGYVLRVVLRKLARDVRCSHYREPDLLLDGGVCVRAAQIRRAGVLVRADDADPDASGSRHARAALHPVQHLRVGGYIPPDTRAEIPRDGRILRVSTRAVHTES